MVKVVVKPSLTGFAGAQGAVGSQCCQSKPVTRKQGVGPASHGNTGQRGGAGSSVGGPENPKNVKQKNVFLDLNRSRIRTPNGFLLLFRALIYPHFLSFC